MNCRRGGRGTATTEDRRAPRHQAARRRARGARRSCARAAASPCRRDRRTCPRPRRRPVRAGCLRLPRSPHQRTPGTTRGDGRFTCSVRSPGGRQPPSPGLPRLRADRGCRLCRGRRTLPGASGGPRVRHRRGRGRLLGSLPCMQQPRRGIHTGYQRTDVRSRPSPHHEKERNDRPDELVRSR